MWGYNKPTRTRTIETHVWRLRRKLGEAGAAARWLRNIPGVGYALSPDVMDPTGETISRAPAGHRREQRAPLKRGLAK